jgi:hypothetical protein
MIIRIFIVHCGICFAAFCRMGYPATLLLQFLRLAANPHPGLNIFSRHSDAATPRDYQLEWKRRSSFELDSSLSSVLVLED